MAFRQDFKSVEIDFVDGYTSIKERQALVSANVVLITDSTKQYALGCFQGLVEILDRPDDVWIVDAGK